MIAILRLLYIGDRIHENMHVVHITFLVRRISGTMQMGYEPEDGANPITGIEMVPIRSLTRYGFVLKFLEFVINNFPGSGNYIGDVKNIKISGYQ